MASADHGRLRPEQANDLGLLIDSVPALIHTALPDGYIDFFNEPWLAYVGRPIEDLEGWKWTSAIHPDDVDEIVEKWRLSLASGEPFLHEARVRRADGEYRWMLHHKIALRDEHGKILKWHGSSIDIEDRRRAEKKVADSERYLRELIDSIPQHVMVLDPSGRLLHANRMVLDYTGRTLEEMLEPEIHKRYLRDRLPPDSERVERERREGLASLATFETERQTLGKDEQYRWFLYRYRPILDEAGRAVRWYCTATDIHDRKQAERRLQQSEAYLAEAQRLSRTGSFGWNVSTGEIFWSDETFRIFECDPTTIPTVELVLSRVHPEDRGLMKQKIDQATRDGDGFDFEHRLQLPDGSIKHVRVTAHASPDGKGNLDFVGAITDVSEQREAEAVIQHREIELQQILDLTPQHIGVLGPDGTPLYANHAALEYYGVSIGEWRDKMARFDLVHPDDRAQFLSQGKSLFLAPEPHEFEARMLRHDRQFRCHLFRLNPLKDEHGNVTRWYGTATDIEDRKQAEDRLQRENIALREEIVQASMFEEIVGSSESLRNVLTQVSKVAPTDSTVLIFGETGTGKELIARAIHGRSNRADRAFIRVNCAAIPKDLIASELFGHEKGAFTGALQRRLGRFELADGGTIFLDEIGDLPPETQIALLRVLQEKEFERVGASHSIRVDTRVLAATNRDLQEAVNAGAFRRDLYYRLNVFPIEIPPLRDRADDIPMLVEYFIARYARKVGKKIRGIQKRTLDLLLSYSWPGNVRELQNVIERSLIVCETENFSVDESWLSFKPAQTCVVSQPLAKLSFEQEKSLIEKALAQTRGRISGPSGAAAQLGMPASTLESRIRSHKINKFRFKTGDGDTTQKN